MTVEELIEELKKLPQHEAVFFFDHTRIAMFNIKSIFIDKCHDVIITNAPKEHLEPNVL